VTARKSNSGLSDKATQLKQTRTAQLSQIQEIISVIEPRLKKASGYQKSQLSLLESVSLGLYDEIDKLAKKAPAEPVTDLVFSEMNQVIRETKELVVEDPYVQRLQEFIAAGDNPQHRDAVVVLRQLRQGLARFHEKLDALIYELRDKYNETDNIKQVLEIYMSGNESISAKDLKAYDIDISDWWLIGNYPNKEFDFSKLDKISIDTRFGNSNIYE
jgi:hypothetical protein